MVTISVVIPALDESERIRGAIESAFDGGDPGEIEVCVIDGGSRDDTPARARRAGPAAAGRAGPSELTGQAGPGGCARPIVLERSDWARPGEPPGRARQLQVGLEATSGEIVLFLHADTRLPPGWRVEVERAMARPDVSGGAFRLGFERAPDGTGAPSRLALAAIAWGVRLRVALFGRPYGDQALFVRRAVLERAGGVPQVPLMEDLDLVRIIKQHGRLVVLTQPALTSPRRYLRSGVASTALRHVAAAVGYELGVDRARLARWVRR